jgi:hypothetical protein
MQIAGDINEHTYNRLASPIDEFSVMMNWITGVQ